jgi:hypothetical protein
MVVISKPKEAGAPASRASQLLSVLGFINLTSVRDNLKLPLRDKTVKAPQSGAFTVLSQKIMLFHPNSR